MVALRWTFFALALSTTAAAMSRLWVTLRLDGLTGAELLFMILVTVLFGLISASFWLFCIGAYAHWRGNIRSSLTRPQGKDLALRDSASRVAIVFPVCNEEAGRVFAGIEAVGHSVSECRAQEHFDFFILSDSSHPSQISAEEREWPRLRSAMNSKLFYRRRTRNVGKKSGNIADFCRNWGALYDYMVVLDADSLMTGETLTTLVRLMDANPRTALIQVPPQLVGRHSLFARIQQFASSVYGNIYATGLALLQGGDGNYWGHNAIIRVQAFMENCGLPTLPGRSPLGGEILSHDFVEAALLRRAGWELHLATDLGGSFEEPPPTLLDHLKRDRRWCQGNLQHMPLIFAQGFRTESRGHLALGVMTYLSSPLWLLMFIASAIVMLNQKPFAPFSYVGRLPVLGWPVSHENEFIALVATMLAMLYAPKLIALFLILRDPQSRRDHGGGWKISLSVFLESILSTLLAPIAMLSQSGFVISILCGQSQGWLAQQRSEHRPALSMIARVFGVHTFIALAAGAAIYVWLPGSFWWFVLPLIGPAVSIPLAVITSSSTIGRAASRIGLFRTPSEIGRTPIVDRIRATMERTEPLRAPG